MVVDNRLPRKSVVRSLRKLCITVSEDSSPFLDSLMLPALKEFEIEVYFEDDDVDDVEGPLLTTPHAYKTILDLLTRSNCKLDRLELSNCGFSPSVIRRCFEHKSLETIEALKIGNVRDQSMTNDKVLARLTILPSSSPSRILLLKLTCLELEMCLAASPGKLGRMVYSRHFLPGKRGVERLKYFSVDQKFHRADKDLINKAVLDGLEVEISDTTSDDPVDPHIVLASLLAMYH
ncbi:hypothetical protein F5887DRAFT_1185157 [Amanita rubescens]|nr:hypothetical protein F5887DRAFT_1185157 [Amanita rubescens]